MHAQPQSVLQDKGDGCNVEIAEKHFITLNSGCSCRKQGAGAFLQSLLWRGSQLGSARMLLLCSCSEK